MCGLVGFFGRVALKELCAFEDLLQLGVLRGDDSTGVALISQRNKITIVKDNVLPTEILCTSQYMDASLNKKSILILLMGHNRAATRGEITKKNAHPFKKGHIVGIHNGTLYTKYQLDSENVFDTDSEAIFNSIEKQGIKETWKYINGGCALIWWDIKEKTLNFLRNDLRPLYFAFLEDNKGLFWASEGWMLRAIAERRGLVFTPYKVEEKLLGKIVQPCKDYHWKFTYQDKKIGWKTKRIEKINYIKDWQRGDKFPFRGEEKENQRKYPEHRYDIYGQLLENFDSNKPEYPKHNMKRKKFLKVFLSCACCSERFDKFNYKNAITIDKIHAICFNCVKSAKDFDLLL